MIELARDAKQTRLFEAAWGRSEHDTGRAAPLERGWRRSVNNFLAAGLTQEFLGEAISIAMENDRVLDVEVWRYFCGICWQEIKEIQRIATQVVVAREAAANQHAVSSAEDEFPFMDTVDLFLLLVLRDLRVDSAVVQRVRNSLWGLIPRAGRFWLNWVPSGRDADRYDDLVSFVEAEVESVVPSRIESVVS